MSNKVNYYGLDLKALKERAEASGERYKPLSQLEVEMLMYGNPDPESQGGLSKMEHGKHLIQMLWPWWWKYWNDWSELMFWAWCNYEEVGTTGCAAAWKTSSFSGFAQLEFLVRPGKTRVVLTSTTIPSLRGRIWSEQKNLYTRLPVNWGFNMVDSKQTIQLKKGEDKYSISGIAVDAGDIDQAIGKIQGNHPGRMVILVDEAAQTKPAVFTARANLRTGTSFYRFAALANASDQFDEHGKFCEPKNGWSTISDDDEYWETRSGVCLHFDGLKAPNVKAGKKIFPRMFNQDDIDKIRRDHGEDSLEWWMYVRGFWAPSGVRNTVLSFSVIQEGEASLRAQWEGSGKRMLAGLDPAFTTGGDRCILRFAEAGNFMDGAPGLNLTDTIHIQLREDPKYPINYQIADRVIDECGDRGVMPEDFTMDSTSASGLVDILSQRWSREIRGVQFGGAAIEGPVSTEDQRDARKVYGNRVTQLWFGVYRIVVAGRMRGLDTPTAKEFCTRQYELKNEKTVVEPKREMKKRTGESPDLADPTCLIVERFYQLYGPQRMAGGAVPYDLEWDRVASKYNLASSYK